MGKEISFDINELSSQVDQEEDQRITKIADEHGAPTLKPRSSKKEKAPPKIKAEKKRQMNLSTVPESVFDELRNLADKKGCRGSLRLLFLNLASQAGAKIPDDLLTDKRFR